MPALLPTSRAGMDGCPYRMGGRALRSVGVERSAGKGGEGRGAALSTCPVALALGRRTLFLRL